MEEKKEMDPRVFEYAKRNNWLLDGELSIAYLKECLLEFGNLKYVPKYVLRVAGLDLTQKD